MAGFDGAPESPDRVPRPAPIVGRAIGGGVVRPGDGSGAAGQPLREGESPRPVRRGPRDGGAFPEPTEGGGRWRERAACIGANPRLFDGGSASVEQAAPWCARCPVAAQCRDWAASSRYSGVAAGSAWRRGVELKPAVTRAFDGRTASCVTKSARVSMDSNTATDRRRSPVNRKPNTSKANQPTAAARLCACGCGATVARQFKPGHDARFLGALVRAARNGEMSKARAIAAARKVSPALGAKAESRLAAKPAVAPATQTEEAAS